jgi:hypothetical protein
MKHHERNTSSRVETLLRKAIALSWLTPLGRQFYPLLITAAKKPSVWSALGVV